MCTNHPLAFAHVVETSHLPVPVHSRSDLAGQANLAKRPSPLPPSQRKLTSPGTSDEKLKQRCYRTAQSHASRILNTFPL